MDWADLESFSRPPPARGGPCADPEASWGHRKNNLLRSENELFFGYYFSAGIMEPVRQDVDPEATSGRGLLLVEALSAEWGTYTPERSTGKVVWALASK